MSGRVPTLNIKKNGLDSPYSEVDGPGRAGPRSMICGICMDRFALISRWPVCIHGPTKPTVHDMRLAVVVFFAGNVHAGVSPVLIRCSWRELTPTPARGPCANE